MADEIRCPSCGAVRPANAPEGLCPRCLMRNALGEETSVPPGSAARIDPGPTAVGPGPEQHEPIADPGEPCIALIVIERPIVLTGPFGRWLNPLVRRDLI